jgi:hypothetical protein
MTSSAKPATTSSSLPGPSNSINPILASSNNSDLSKSRGSSITITHSSNGNGNGAVANASNSGNIFNDENFLKKLDSVTPTQDCIQSLALWIIHHKTSHETICRLWSRKFHEGRIENPFFKFYVRVSGGPKYLYFLEILITFMFIEIN